MSVQPDLHSHTTASDGTLTPAALVRRARAAGIRMLAVTDHDTLEGIAEAEQEAVRAGLILIPGVEISVTWGGRTVHVVGLNINPSACELARGLARLRAFRDWRAEEMGRRLGKAGIADAFVGARALSNGRLISRTHFARFLVQAGVARSEREVFQGYLVSGKPGHVAGEWATLEETVGWILAAGGQAVLAHPARYRLTRSKLLGLIREFAEAGGEALEVVSGSHSPEEVFVMARHAQQAGLLASAGSDYHGPESTYVELGRVPNLPDICAPIWRAASWLPEPQAAVG